MVKRVLSWFRRGEEQAKADFTGLVERVRAKVVTSADVVFVSIKGADAHTMGAAKKQLSAIAPEIRFIVHDESVKVSAVIKKLEDRVKSRVSRKKK